MIGFGANRRGGRLPSFILIALMVIIAVLSFNYWTVTSKHGRLLDELAEVQTQMKRTDAARSRLEKRNSELNVQVDAHRKQVDQKDGDNSVLEGKLQAREAVFKRCTDEKMKIQNDVTSQMTEISRLKEQLKELKQEFMKQEDQMREVKKNNTNLEKKLEYESLQCGRQVAQLKEDYEDTKKTLEEEAMKLRQSLLNSQKAGAAEGGTETDQAGERHTVATRQDTDLKDLGKPGSDAGMPGIEDNDLGKTEDVQFALKKPAITQDRIKIRDVELREVGAGMGAGAGEGAGLSLDRPVLQNQDTALRWGMQGQHLPHQHQLPHQLPHQQQLPHQLPHQQQLPHQLPHQQQQPLQPVADGLFDEDNKADELGEQKGQLGAPDNVVKADGAQVKMPPNPAQVPNPIEPRHARDPKPAEPPRHRQNDEDRDMLGDRAVDYGKRRQAIDIL